MVVSAPIKDLRWSEVGEYCLHDEVDCGLQARFWTHSRNGGVALNSAT